jgi:hypothetical protein
MRIQVALAGAVLTLAACSSAHPSLKPAHHPTPATATPTPSATGYPKEAADKALCATYQSLSQNGDFAGIPVAVASADGSVTENLANVLSRQGPTLQQDEKNDVLVAENCALVSVGKPPTMSQN